MRDHPRLLDKLLRELVRGEWSMAGVVDQERRRLGDVPPVDALRQVADHAAQMRPRLHRVLAHLETPSTERFGIRLTMSRPLVDLDGERAYRAVLLDLRQGVDVVRILRETARSRELFALIRWCDDWLATRRTLVERVEAQLDWFAAPGVGSDA